MAKKKENNIVITDKELTPTIIGKLDTKEKSPVLLIFIFIIFIAVAIFLPDITNYIEEYLHGNNTKVNTNKNVSTNDNQEDKGETEKELTYYDYTPELVITNETFEISNIVISENKIYFDIKNITDKVLNLDNVKYFLEIYSSDTTLLQRIKISYDSIGAGEAKNYSYDLDLEVATKLSKLLIASKTEGDYPEIVLNTNEEGKGILTCIKNEETITYTFGNNELTNINHVLKYLNTNSDYIITLQSYQTLAATNNNYPGVSSTLITSETGFVYTTLIDLQKNDLSLLNNNNYYKYKTKAKTVKFETESNGYSCS